MSNRTPFGNQVDTIDRNAPFVQESFDLDRLDNFVAGLGVQFYHFKAMPSPIGLKDRGDYRRSDGVDTITSNGMIYTCAGKFTATMTDNQRGARRGDAGVLDPSESRLVMPRFYDIAALADGSRIYVMPGDRIYVADPLADVKVANYQRMDFEPDVDNQPMFPILEMDGPILDSRNIEYQCGKDFTITPAGDIRWGANNPGIDPDTGKGRVYAMRYMYKAYWYITKLLKEVRVTNVTTDGQRGPARMPYFVAVTREYIFHNQNKGDKTNQLKPRNPNRVQEAPVQATNPNKNYVPVDMSNIENFTVIDGDGDITITNDEEQS